MAERNLSIRLSVVDGGKVKAELSEIGEKGERSLKKIEAAATPAFGGLKLLSSAANDAKFQLEAATDRLGLLGSVLGRLGPAGLLAGASIAALGVGITALVMPVARVGDEFFKLSQKTGVSVEALTALKYAADLSDLSTEGLTKALQKLSVAMFDTQINGEEGSAALKALGVSATDVNGQIRPTEQVLLDLADKFSSMPDGADKAALAVKLFGKRNGSANSDTGIKGDGLAQLGEDFAHTRRADREKTPSQPLPSLQGEGRVRCHSRRATSGRTGHQARRPRHADRAVESRSSEGRRSRVRFGQTAAGHGCRSTTSSLKNRFSSRPHRESTI